MKIFSKNIVVGTMVQVIGSSEFYAVTAVDEDRRWIEVQGYVGEFQRGDVIRYTNKARAMSNVKELERRKDINIHPMIENHLSDYC